MVAANFLPKIIRQEMFGQDMVSDVDQKRLAGCAAHSRVCLPPRRGKLNYLLLKTSLKAGLFVFYKLALG